MLTGNLVLTRTTATQVIPRFLDRGAAGWLEVAESLLLIYRESLGRTRGEIEDDVTALIGEGGGFSLLVSRGLAKVLEDRAEFEVVADIAPEKVRECVFSLAAEARRKLVASQKRTRFERERVLAAAAAQLGTDPAQIDRALFADLKDENRMIAFDDLSAQDLVDRYNVALVQAILLRAVNLRAEVGDAPPALYRHLFRMLKFHRLLARVGGSTASGYQIEIDGPLSLFSSTTRYGLQLALFLPTLLTMPRFRLQAELRWGARREPRVLTLDERAGLVTHHEPKGQYVPAEVAGFLDRFRQIAPDWDVHTSSEIVELGAEGVWIPDFRFVHRATGIDVWVEVLGFWKRGSIERLLRVLPSHGPPRYLLAISERLKVEEADVGALTGPVLRFKEVPNAGELRGLLQGFLSENDGKAPR